MLQNILAVYLLSHIQILLYQRHQLAIVGEIMDGKINAHMHHVLKVTKVEKQFVDAIKENKEYLNTLEGIDLGAGGGRFSKILCKYVKNLHSVDVSDEAIAAMKKNLKGIKNIAIVKAPKNSLPFKDRSIDVVFAANSFHDVPMGYEKEIKRVLKPGGRFIDLDWKKEETEFGPPLRIRFSEEDVEEKMKIQNFRLVKKQDIDTHYLLIFSKKKA